MKTLIISILILANIGLFSQTKRTFEPEHKGFFMQGNVGFGSTTINESMNTPSLGQVDIHMSGLSTNMNLRFGYSVVKNTQVYAMFGANLLSKPTMTINGSEATGNTSTSVSLSHYGGGVSYYFMPSNVYALVELSSGQNEIEVNSTSGKSQNGLVLSLGVGKEWFISKHWGLGGMIYFYTGSIDDEPFEGQTPKIENTGFGISFSATFN